MGREAFKLLCADGDGTLYDTRQHLTDAMVASMDDLGVIITAGEAHRAIAEGIGLHAACIALAPDLDPLAVEERFYYYDEELGYDNIRPYNGLYDMIDSLRGRRMEIAIVTNRTRVSTLKILAHLGLSRHIDINDSLIFAPTETMQPKPAPDQVLAAAKMANNALSEVVVMGDSAGDIKAGKAAGVGATIGFTDGLGTVEDLKNAGADYMISNLWQVSKALISLAARS